MVNTSPKEQKTMWGEKKLLSTSYFSFFATVFSEDREEVNPFKRQLLNSSKLKEFSDDNFKLTENGRKLSKWVENTVGKEEIARNEQFLLFPHCFQKTSTADTYQGLFGKGLTCLRKKPSQNMVRNVENAANQHFLLFARCFPSFPNQISHFHSHLFGPIRGKIAKDYNTDQAAQNAHITQADVDRNFLQINHNFLFIRQGSNCNGLHFFFHSFF